MSIKENYEGLIDALTNGSDDPKEVDRAEKFIEDMRTIKVEITEYELTEAMTKAYGSPAIQTIVHMVDESQALEEILAIYSAVVENIIFDGKFRCDRKEGGDQDGE